jgi:radical SAM protein with 4Fe4S-binding SPASM domain
MAEARTKGMIDRLQRQWSYWRLLSCVPTNPQLLHLEPSGACNLRCLICPQSVGEKKPAREQLMSMETFEKILNDAKGIFKEIYFAVGGEPLMNPYLPEMVRKATAAGIETTIHTNVTLLTHEKSAELIEAGLTRITLNIIDTKEEYELVRQGANFEKSVANIRSFLELKKEMGRGPQTTLQIIKPHREGCDSEPQIDPKLLESFAGMPIDRKVCAWAHHFGGDFAETGKLEFDEPQRAAEYFPCEGIWMSLMVSCDGTVHPCCIDIQNDYPLGNVLDKPLIEFWNCDKMVRLRKELAAGHYQSHLCKNCQLLWRETKKGGAPKERIYGALFKLIARKPRVAPKNIDNKPD